MEEHKADKREGRRRKKQYGHFGMGASHTREASKEEVEGHIRKIKQLRKKQIKKQMWRKGRK